MQQKFKVMAYHKSTGVWNRCRQIKLGRITGERAENLTADLAAWQAGYDVQFRKYTYEFDWDAFNQRGYELAERIQKVAPENAFVYYVESDDRDFFSPEDCCRAIQQRACSVD